MLIFFFSNLTVLAAAIILVFGFFKVKGLIDCAIAVFLIYFSQIVLTLTVLGIAGKLSSGYIILVNFLILILVYLGFGKKIILPEAGTVSQKINELFKNKLILFGVSLILGFGICKIAVNLVNPPFGWDCLNYHFPFPVYWLKASSFITPITIGGDPSPPYYPINGSLYFFWLMFPFKNFFIADLGQIPFFVLSSFAIFSICRKLKLDKEMSFFASALFLLTPNVFKHMEIAYVDIMLASLFLACLSFLISLYGKLSLKYLCLAAVAFGLFLGVKTSAIVYASLLLLLLAVILLRNIGKKKINLYSLLFMLIVFIIIALALGGFSYINNLLLTSNPLFPAGVSFFGKDILKGVMPFSTYRDRWTEEEFNLGKMLFHEGLGGQFLLFAIPAALFSLPIVLFRRRSRRDFLSLFIAVLPLFLYLEFWLFMPQLWVRYFYPFLACAYISAFFILNLLNFSRFALRIIFCICALASISEFSGHLELVSSILLSIFLFFTLPWCLRKIKFNLRFFILLLLFLSPLIYLLNVDYGKNEFARYLKNTPFPGEEKEAWFWLNENTRSSRIAYTGAPDVLPLFGANLKNEALYVSVNTVHPVKLHYFSRASYVWGKDFLSMHSNFERDNNYREHPDFAAWLKNMYRENIDFLFVYSFHQVKEPVFPIEDEWARSHPGIFKLEFKNAKVHIYRLIK